MSQRHPREIRLGTPEKNPWSFVCTTVLNQPGQKKAAEQKTTVTYSKPKVYCCGVFF